MISRALLFVPALLFSGAALVAANQLEGAKSSYLASHDKDEVDWLPWGDAAFAKAKTEQKPIYLCIGFFTNELSRAMQKQSFNNPKVVALLKQDFICILVDRDERPDIGALFQAYLRAAKQMNGWPVNVWLTPEGKPFDGATYLPPSEEWGKEGLLNVLQRVSASWKSSAEASRQQANEGAASTAAGESFEPGPVFNQKSVDETLNKIRQSILDTANVAQPIIEDASGHPDPELLRWLLRSPGASRNAAIASLRALDRSTLHDPLDGGFFHRAISTSTQFPSFQKLLGDQARFALAYLDAAKETQDPSLAGPARAALDYVLLKLARPNGVFIHAEDATPEELAAAFGWTRAEVLAQLGDENGNAFALAYGVKAEGNISPDDDPGNKWKGKNLLALGATKVDAENEARFAADRAKLLQARQTRPQPLRDENVLVGENGILLTALTTAARQLHEPRYQIAAKKLAGRLQSSALAADGRLLRLLGDDALAAPEDYADLALGWSSFSAIPDNASYRNAAEKLLQVEEREFFDASVGRFFAQYPGTPHLWMRTHTLDPQAGDLPSAETATLLAKSELKIGPSALPASLLRTLTASLASPDGTPRGDVLLAAADLAAQK